MEGTVTGTLSKELSREGHLTEALHRRTEPIFSGLAGRISNTMIPIFLPHSLLWCPQWSNPTRSQRARKSIDTVHKDKLLGTEKCGEVWTVGFKGPN